MRQCPDCEEKDRVVIAGKVFCANCGTPWEPADPAEAAAYAQKSGVTDAKAPTQPAPPIPPAPAPSSGPAVAPAPEAIAPTATPPVPVSTPASPSTQVPPAPVDSNVGSEIPSLDAKEESVLSDDQMKEMVQAQINNLSQPASNPPAATTPPPQAPPVPATPAPLATPSPAPSSTPNTSASVVSPASGTPEPAPVVQSAPAVPSAPATVATPEPSLEVTPPPVPSANGSRIMNDIMAPAPVVMQATPAPVATPAPQAPVASPVAPTAPAPAPMMSRDEALKLALGEDAAAPAPATPSAPAKPTAIVMSVIALGLLGTLLWRTNYPDISLKIAAMRSGLSASMPGFVPAGWSKAQNVKTSNGSMSYQLVKDSKSLQVNQQKTDWDSQAVLEQYVLKRSPDYLALQASGLTIYMYGDGQAAWVNQGTLYTISGEHGLSQEDVIRMATSL